MQSSSELNILLVDDRASNLLALEAIFDGLDYNLVKADSGEVALQCMLKQDFVVVLLDVQMPGIDGFETASLIRARERSRHTPIIFLTAINKSEEHVFKGYSVGAVDYLFKPIVPEILKAKVAVFVDLQKKTLELEEIRQREQRAREIRLLDEQLSKSEKINITAQAYGVGLLSKTAPDIFQEILSRYSQLLELALEERAYKVEHNISIKLRNIADQLGNLWKAGPRDVAEIHATTLKRKINDLQPQRAEAYIKEGHLIAFELMGYLVSYYRNFYIGKYGLKQYVSSSKEEVNE